MTSHLQKAYGCDQETLGRVNKAKLENFRQRLGLLRYTEERIAKRLQISHPAVLELSSYPIYQERVAQRPDDLSLLISLFLLQNEVLREAANATLTASVVEELLRLGVLRQASTSAVAANVSLYPCSGSYFITDHRFQPQWPTNYTAPSQPVMHLGEDSYALAYLTPKPSKGAHVLDLCTGSGVQAILAARRTEHVVGVDVNPRAVSFARFNAALNGVDVKADFRCGNLYDPLDKHEDSRFDLILANPPFIPSSNSGADRLLFQDAGPTGDQIFGPILNGLLTHLKTKGMAVIISLFVDTKRSSVKKTIRRWIGSRVPVDLLLIEFYSIDPEEFASWGATWRLFEDDFAAYAQRYKERLDLLRSEEILRLTHGILVVRMSNTSRFHTIRMAVPRRPQQNVIKRVI